MSENFQALQEKLSAAPSSLFKNELFIEQLLKVVISNNCKRKELRELWKSKNKKTYDEDRIDTIYDEAKEKKSKKTYSIDSLDKFIEPKDKNTDDFSLKGLCAIQMIHEEESYKKLKSYFESSEGWCKIDSPACYGRVVTTDEGVTFTAEQSPQTYFENKYYTVLEYSEKKQDYVEKHYPFFPTWKTDLNIKSYSNIVFDPKNRDQKALNLFASYCSIAEAKHKLVDISIIFEHLRSLCGYDEACYEYFLNYCAHIIQKPEERCNVSIVIYGSEGVGKNLYLSLIGNIIGKQYYKESSSPEDIFGKFATGMYKKIMFVYDEGEKAQTGQYMSRLKTLVTCDELRVELKGKDAYTVENYCRLFFPTNSREPFPITKGARRWQYMKASDKYILLPKNESVAHFDKLVEFFGRKDVQYTFYKFLKDRDISQYNPNKTVVSEGFVQALQVPLILRCLHEKIFSNIKTASSRYNAAALLDTVIGYCKENNYSHNAYNPTTLSNELQQYMDFGCVTKTRTNKGIEYKFDIEKFKEYIKKYNFNLDIDEEDEDIDENDEEYYIKKTEREIEDLKQLIEKKLQKIEEYKKGDPLEHGVVKMEYSIKQDRIYIDVDNIYIDVPKKRIIPIDANLKSSKKDFLPEKKPSKKNSPKKSLLDDFEDAAIEDEEEFNKINFNVL